jgi:hypothetical protein
MAFKPVNSTFVDRSSLSRAFIDPAIVLLMFMLSFIDLAIVTAHVYVAIY